MVSLLHQIRSLCQLPSDPWYFIVKKDTLKQFKKHPIQAGFFLLLAIVISIVEWAKNISFYCFSDSFSLTKPDSTRKDLLPGLAQHHSGSQAGLDARYTNTQSITLFSIQFQVTALLPCLHARVHAWKGVGHACVLLNSKSFCIFKILSALEIKLLISYQVVYATGYLFKYFIADFRQLSYF